MAYMVTKPSRDCSVSVKYEEAMIRDDSTMRKKAMEVGIDLLNKLNT